MVFHPFLVVINFGFIKWKSSTAVMNGYGKALDFIGRCDEIARMGGLFFEGFGSYYVNIGCMIGAKKFTHGWQQM